MRLRILPIIQSVALLLAPSLTTGEQGKSPKDSAALIGREDTVTILALNVEEISKPWRVGYTGDISLPMLGRVHATGRTVEQLEQELSVRLKRFVHDPQVTVFISEFRSHPVTVSGAVDKPGVLQLQGPTPLYAVVVQAGGPKDAGPMLTLTRNREYGMIPHPEARTTADGKYSLVELPLKDAVRGDGQSANLMVMPYDVISVSQEKRQKLVFVSGEVNKPGAIELVNQDAVSVSKALAMAGGLTHIASPGKTMIRHINPNGIETAFTFVDLKKVLSGKAKDLVLSEGDIVIVPSSQLNSYLQTLSATALTSGVYILGRL